MHKKPVTIIAHHEHLPDYDFIAGLGEQVIMLEFDPAVDVSIKHETDLILLDCGMFDAAGVTLITKLKLSFPRVPIIFITGTPSGSSAVQAFKAGARECFMRPLEPSELHISVVSILRLKRESFRQSHALSIPANGDLLQQLQQLHQGGNLPERLKRAMQFMEQNFSKSVYLMEIAREACLSKYHFCRIFKQYVGMTPLEYVSFLRIEQAKQLLRQSQTSVTLISMSVGFNDPSNFIKLFKKFTGMTPSSYKNLRTS